MARITVEDCLEKVDNHYDLVLLAKERTTQLNSGSPMLVEEDNDKNTIIAHFGLFKSPQAVKKAITPIAANKPKAFPATFTAVMFNLSPSAHAKPHASKFDAVNAPAPPTACAAMAPPTVAATTPEARTPIITI